MKRYHYGDLYNRPDSTPDLGLTIEAYYRKWDNYDDILLGCQSETQHDRQLERWEEQEAGRTLRDGRMVWASIGDGPCIVYRSRPQW